MKFGVMITHGPGGHPSWKHAEVLSQQLIIDPAPEAENYGAKCEAAGLLRRQLRAEFENHHERVKNHELDMLGQHGKARHSHPLEPEAGHLDDAVGLVVKLTKGTVLEAHYARPDVQDALRQVIALHFRTQQSIHRAEHKQHNKE